MSNGQWLVLIAVAALASSLCTLALGLVIFRYWVRPRLESWLEALAELLEARVKAGARAAGQELMEPLRTQVPAAWKRRRLNCSPKSGRN